MPQYLCVRVHVRISLFDKLLSQLRLHVKQYVVIQVELEEAGEKVGPEIEDARKTIEEVEKLFQTVEA